jgi:DNA-binding response OmpR family regulator
MKKIAVYTLDRLLYRRLCLLFDGRYEVIHCPDGGDIGADIRVSDLDTLPAPVADIRLSRHAGEGVIMLPFSQDELDMAIARLEKRDTGRLILIKDTRTVQLGDRSVKLTEVEFRLFSVLVSAGAGEYVSRERLIREVWGEGVDGGVVNVYIHYLREKLEKDGERIIISSRREGYKINERAVTVC